MRTIKALLSAVLLVFSLSACGSKTVYKTYTLNPTKTFVLVKSYWCEDVMNDEFQPVAEYMAQPPQKCRYSTLDLEASAQSASIRAIYQEPNYYTIKPDGTTEVEIFPDSVSELVVNASLGMPQTLTKGEAVTLTLSVNGHRTLDKSNRNIAAKIGTSLIIRPMTVIQNVYQSAFSDPWLTVDSEFDASADPWQLEPQDPVGITSFSGEMTLTLPESVQSKTVCLIGRLVLSHFEYIIFTYYEGQP